MNIREWFLRSLAGRKLIKRVQTQKFVSAKKVLLAEELEARLLLNADPQAVLTGMEMFLDTFSDSMRDNVLALKIPLLGDGLEDSVAFLDDMTMELQDAYATVDEELDPSDPATGNEYVQKMLFEAWVTNLNLLVDENNTPISQYDEIEIVENSGFVQFNCHLFVDIFTYDQQFDIDESLGFDFGFDIFSIDIEGEVFFQVGFDWQLNFGQLKDSSGNPTEFYIDTTAKPGPDAISEMEFYVEAAIPDLQASGTFLVFGANVTDEDADDNESNNGMDIDGDGILPSQLKGVFNIDIHDQLVGNGDGILTLTELGLVDEAADLVDASVRGGLHRDIQGYTGMTDNGLDVADQCLIDINLNIDINYSEAEEFLPFGDNETDDMQLPHFSFDFRFAWFMFDTPTTYNATTDEVEFGPDPLDYIPVVEFNDISFHLGQFISGFAGPVLQAYQFITTPVRPLIEWFNEPIPVLSDLADDDSLTLAKLAGFIPKIGPIIEALNSVVYAVQFADAFPEDEDITFNFGDFQLASDFRSLNELKDDVENIVNNTLDFLPLGIGDQITEEIYDFLNQNSGVMEPVGFSFPILTKPSEFVNFILGGNASLVEFVVPAVSLPQPLSYEAKFPIFPPFLNVGLGGYFDVGLRLGFGFDTYGLTKFAETGVETDIFQGFYLRDKWLNDQGVLEDLPELYLEAGIYASAFAGIPGLIEGGARGGIEADIGIDLHDIDDLDEGRVRFYELQQRLNQSWYCMFDAGGSLSAFLEAYVWVGLDLGLFEITIYEDSWSIAGGEILSFNWSCPENNSDPALATLAPNGSAIAPNGDIVPNDGSVPGAVPLPDGSLLLNMGPRANHRGDSGFGGCTQDKNESFTVSQQDIEVEEGVWENKIVVAALGFEQYFDPALVNNIYAEGGLGRDTIRILDSVVTTGTNEEMATSALYGDFRSDTDDGPEPLNTDGETDDGIDNEDKLYAGPGGGFMYGGDGNDKLRGNDGIDIIYGGSGDDYITGKDGDDQMWGGSNEDTIRGDNDNDEIHGGSENDRLYGSNDDDVIYGDAGHDIIKGDRHNDIIYGGLGDDKLIGGGGDDTLYGDQGNDVMEGNGGMDVLYGGLGRDTITGNSDDDILNGGEGVDLLFGDNGAVNAMSLELALLYKVDADGRLILDENGKPIPADEGDTWTITFVPAQGNDMIYGDEDNDIIFGDNGMVILDDDGNIAQTIPMAAEVAGEDKLFGGSGDDTIYGGSGDDYIEGNAGEDLIYGNLGQDDIIGGSSNLYGLTTAAQRPDGSDIIYGGSGLDMARNTLGDETEGGHARDADVILGDNGIISRLLDPQTQQYLTYNYDNYAGTLRIVPRRFELLDYTPGGSPDDIGATDIIHGEAGDDVIYGMTGDDVIFGEGQDDDLYGGTGNDWISGGTGMDGIIGDDGLIITSRNGLAEPVYGIEAIPPGELNKTITVSGTTYETEINIEGELKKAVDLEAFEDGGDDIIYGGLGNDFLHGSAGDDAISGAEAIPIFYNAALAFRAGGSPLNPGNVLQFDPDQGRFTAYDPDDPFRKIIINGLDFLLNFEAATTTGVKINDGADVIFGDLGNDWLVGGTNSDSLYGGYGNDLLNADDNHDTTASTTDPLANDVPDDAPFDDADIACGGAGLDVLIANTEADRLIDWVGNFNTYLVPFSRRGMPTISRSPQPKLETYLCDLSESDGADQTLGTDPTDNGEPEGELGLVDPHDADWQDQTGPPVDPHLKNLKKQTKTK